MEEAEKQGRLQLQQALPHVVAAGNGKRQTTRSGSRAGSRRSGLVHYGRIDVVEVDRRKDYIGGSKSCWRSSGRRWDGCWLLSRTACIGGGRDSTVCVLCEAKNRVEHEVDGGAPEEGTDGVAFAKGHVEDKPLKAK